MSLSRDLAQLPPVIDPATLAELLDQQAPLKVLDVRSAAEFQSAHIPGSYNVALDQLPEHRAELRDTLRSPVVLVCRSGSRARQAEQLLRAADLPNIHILDGGLLAWEAARRPVRRGRQRWGLERQVRGVAGAVVLLGALGGLIWTPLLGIAALMGAGLAVSAATDSCGMALLLSKLPYNRDASCDVREMIAAIAETPPATGR